MRHRIRFRIFRIFLSGLVGIVAIAFGMHLPTALAAGGAPISRVASSTTLCGNVSTEAQVLAAGANRYAISLYTTSGANTIYYTTDGSTAAIPPGTGTSASHPLTGGQSRTWDGTSIFTNQIRAIAKTGTVWVCTETQ